MNLSSKSTHFHPQHINKCYCRNRSSCCCAGSKDSTEKPISQHKFIKTQRDGNGNRTRSALSFCSRSSAPTLMTSVSTSSFLHGPLSESRLTERREFYEKSATSNRTMDMGALGNPQQSSQIMPEWFYDDKISKLQEFRLRNADECLSTLSRHLMDTQYRSKGLNQVAEVISEKYTINKRGLLQSYDDRCLETKKKSAVPVAIIVDSNVAAKDILRQKLKTSKEKDKFMRKALCLPDNSLALRYQKTY